MLGSALSLALTGAGEPADERARAELTGACYCRAVEELTCTGDLTERDHYFTARFALWANTRRGLRWTPADHVAWPLHRAELLRLDDSLVTAVGLPEPQGEPVLHHSPGVAVRIGRDHRRVLAVS